jgi:hypothetical protein
MAGIPTSLAIALWVTGACWAVAAIPYLLEADTTFVAPMVIIGVLTGTAEWLLRRKD